MAPAAGTSRPRRFLTVGTRSGNNARCGVNPLYTGSLRGLRAGSAAIFMPSRGHAKSKLEPEFPGNKLRVSRVVAGYVQQGRSQNVEPEQPKQSGSAESNPGSETRPAAAAAGRRAEARPAAAGSKPPGPKPGPEGSLVRTCQVRARKVPPQGGIFLDRCRAAERNDPPGDQAGGIFGSFFIAARTCASLELKNSSRSLWKRCWWARNDATRLWIS